MMDERNYKVPQIIEQFNIFTYFELKQRFCTDKTRTHTILVYIYI